MVGHDPLEFVAELRRAGLEVPLSSSIDFVSALAVVDPDRPDDVYWAGRTTLVRRPEDIVDFDRVFARHFMGIDPTASDIERTSELGLDSAGGADEGAELVRAARVTRWTAVESLRGRDFARCSAAEMAELGPAIDALRVGGPTRETRRWAGGGRGPIDLRWTVSAARRTGGEVVSIRHRRRRRRRRRRWCSSTCRVRWSTTREPWSGSPTPPGWPTTRRRCSRSARASRA
jgi:uncharacterized protein with von Willebrand factor type A (vWA) domain